MLLTTFLYSSCRTYGCFEQWRRVVGQSELSLLRPIELTTRIGEYQRRSIYNEICQRCVSLNAVVQLEKTPTRFGRLFDANNLTQMHVHTKNNCSVHVLSLVMRNMRSFCMHMQVLVFLASNNLPNWYVQKVVLSSLCTRLSVSETSHR